LPLNSTKPAGCPAQFSPLIVAQLPETPRRIGLGDSIAKRPTQDKLIQVSVALVAVDKIPLRQDRPRRSQIAVLAQIVVPVADPMADIMAVAAKVPVIVRPQRVVVMVVATVIRVPRIDAEAEIRVVVIVPEIVMVVAGSDEQVNQQRRRVDHDVG
jgi:hypothetical protein